MNININNTPSPLHWYESTRGCLQPLHDLSSVEDREQYSRMRTALLSRTGGDEGGGDNVKSCKTTDSLSTGGDGGGESFWDLNALDDLCYSVAGASSLPTFVQSWQQKVALIEGSRRATDERDFLCGGGGDAERSRNRHRRRAAGNAANSSSCSSTTATHDCDHNSESGMISSLDGNGSSDKDEDVVVVEGECTKRRPTTVRFADDQQQTSSTTTASAARSHQEVEFLQEKRMSCDGNNNSDTTLAGARLRVHATATAAATDGKDTEEQQGDDESSSALFAAPTLPDDASMTKFPARESFLFASRPTLLSQVGNVGLSSNSSVDTAATTTTTCTCFTFVPHLLAVQLQKQSQQSQELQMEVRLPSPETRGPTANSSRNNNTSMMMIVIGTSQGSLILSTNSESRVGSATATTTTVVCETLSGHDDAVVDLAWPSERHAALHLLSLGLDASAVVWDLARRTKLRSIALPGEPTTGRFLAGNANAILVGLRRIGKKVSFTGAATSSSQQQQFHGTPTTSTHSPSLPSSSSSSFTALRLFSVSTGLQAKTFPLTSSSSSCMVSALSSLVVDKRELLPSASVNVANASAAAGAMRRLDGTEAAATTGTGAGNNSNSSGRDSRTLLFVGHSDGLMHVMFFDGEDATVKPECSVNINALHMISNGAEVLAAPSGAARAPHLSQDASAETSSSTDDRQTGLGRPISALPTAVGDAAALLQAKWRERFPAPTSAPGGGGGGGGGGGSNRTLPPLSPSINSDRGAPPSSSSSSSSSSSGRGIVSLNVSYVNGAEGSGWVPYWKPSSHRHRLFTWLTPVRVILTTTSNELIVLGIVAWESQPSLLQAIPGFVASAVSTATTTLSNSTSNNNHLTSSSASSSATGISTTTSTAASSPFTGTSAAAATAVLSLRLHAIARIRLVCSPLAFGFFFGGGGDFTSATGGEEKDTTTTPPLPRLWSLVDVPSTVTSRAGGVLPVVVCGTAPDVLEDENYSLTTRSMQFKGGLVPEKPMTSSSSSRPAAALSATSGGGGVCVAASVITILSGAILSLPQVCGGLEAYSSRSSSSRTHAGQLLPQQPLQKASSARIGRVRIAATLTIPHLDDVCEILRKTTLLTDNPGTRGHNNTLRVIGALWGSSRQSVCVLTSSGHLLQWRRHRVLSQDVVVEVPASGAETKEETTAQRDLDELTAMPSEVDWSAEVRKEKIARKRNLFTEEMGGDEDDDGNNNDDIENGDGSSSSSSTSLAESAAGENGGDEEDDAERRRYVSHADLS